MQFDIIKWLTISLSFLIKNTLLDMNNMVEQFSVICQSNLLAIINMLCFSLNISVYSGIVIGKHCKIEEPDSSA